MFKSAVRGDEPRKEIDMDPNLALVTQALARTALKGTVLLYGKFHALFPDTVPLARRYAVLEAALNLLNDSTEIDYGVLLSCDNGLPGPDYFLRFRKCRPNTYIATMGDPRFKTQTVKGKRQLVAADRQRVYQHAVQLRHQERERECA
jgi:hypothetical protein